MNRFEAPLYLPVSFPRPVFAAAMLVHVAALVLVWMAGMTAVLAVTGTLFIVLHAWWWCRTRLQMAADGVAAVVSRADGSWQVMLRDGSVHGARLVGRPHVSVPLTALTLRLVRGGHRYLLLTPASSPPDNYRRLRVRLRYGTT